MAKFFIPLAKDEKEAQEVHESIRRLVKEATGWDVTDRRVFTLTYRHDGKLYDVEVGKPDPRIGELVIAILESTTYLICTPNRGVARGTSIMVGKDEVLYATDFEIGS